MWKITETDIVTMALLYRKKYAGTDILPYDSIVRFNDAINKNLEDMGVTDRIDVKNDACSNCYFIVSDQKGNDCVILNPNLDLNSLWGYHLSRWPFEFCVAAETDNALKEINLIYVGDNIVDRNLYYEFLRRKYNLLSEFEKPKFDIFMEFEKIIEDGFVKNFCLSREEQLILDELLENRKQNERQINGLKRKVRSIR